MQCKALCITGQIKAEDVANMFLLVSVYCQTSVQMNTDSSDGLDSHFLLPDTDALTHIASALKMLF